MRGKNSGALRPWTYLISFGLGGAASGLIACISVLMMLSRGLSLSMISLAMALNFSAAVLLEIPSGIAGDLWGRKRVWVFSKLVSMGAMLCYCFGSAPVVLAGCVANGVGTAFSSGTLDALYMERWLHARGGQGVGKAGMWNSIVQYGSQAAGSLAGGLLSTIPLFGRAYTVNLTLALGLILAMTVWTIFTVPADSPARKRPARAGKGPLAQMAQQGKSALQTATGTPVLLLSLLGALVVGFSTVGIELYWQPHMQALAGGGEIGPLLGLLSCGGMAAVVAGNVATAHFTARVCTERGRVALYLAARLLMTGFMILSAVLLRLPAFCAMYLLYYLAMGMQDNADAVLLHGTARDEMRGTIMSVQSLLLRLGALASQAVSAAALAFLSVPALWLLLAAALGTGTAACVLAYAAAGRKRRRTLREGS